MRTVTPTYRQIIASDATREFHVKIDMTLADETELTLTDSDIMSGSFKYETASSGNSSFDIGSAIIGMCKFSLWNYDDAYTLYDFFNATAVVWVKLEGDVEWIRLGFFTVDEPEFANSMVTLELLDNMWRFDVPLSDANVHFSSTSTCFDLISEICSHCDVLLATPIFHGYDFVVSQAPEEDMNCREFLQYVAMIGCNFCIIDSQGQLRLKWYDTSSLPSSNLDGGTFSTTTTPYSDGDDVDGGDFINYGKSDIYDGGTFTGDANVAYLTRNFSATIGTDVITITGVSITVGDTEHTIGTRDYMLSLNNPLVNESNVGDVLNLIWGVLEGMTFRTFNVTALPDISAEVGDSCSIKNIKGHSVNSYITSISFGLSSLTAQCNAVSPTRTLIKRYSKAVQSALVETRKTVDDSISNYDLVVQMMNALAVNAMGAYQSYEDIPTGGRIYYLSNKPITKDSQGVLFVEGSVVFKISGDGFFVSQSAGTRPSSTTFVNGYNAQTGQLVINVLNAIGINAEWVNTGTLTVGGKGTGATIVVKDSTEDENVICTINPNGLIMSQGRIESEAGSWFLDATTGDVQLAATATVGGKTVNEIATNAILQGNNFAKDTITLLRIINGVVTDGHAIYNLGNTLLMRSDYGKTTIRVSFKIKRTGVRNTAGNTYLSFRLHVTGMYHGEESTRDIGRVLDGAVTEDDTNYKTVTGQIPLLQVMDSVTAIEDFRFMSFSNTAGTMEIKEVKVEISDNFTVWTPNEEDILNYLSTIPEQLDGKVASYYQATDPSLEWGGTTIKFNSQCQTENISYDYIDIYYKVGATTHYIRKGGSFGNEVVNIPTNEFWIYWHTDTSVHDYYGWKVDFAEPYTGSDYTTPTGQSALPSYTITDTPIANLESSHNPYEDNVNQIFHSTVNASHEGDLWYRTTDNTTWYYNGYNWEQQSVPQEVFDKIDGKSQIFTSQPTTPYFVGDLWFANTSSEIKVCNTKRTSGSFVSSDWAKRDKYVDSSDISSAVSTYDQNLNQLAVYNKLTNNSQNEGVYLQSGHLYLNATMINTGYLSANRIKGDTLTLGGSNNVNGQLVVKNASGTDIVTANNDGITTTKLTATGDCKFGNLNIGKKTISPYGTPIEVDYLYAEGYKEYYFEEFSGRLSKSFTTYVYVCPKADGWTANADINVSFSAVETSGSHNSELLRVTKQTWNGTKWVDSEYRRYNVNGQEINGKDDWFSGFSASDATTYRFVIKVTRQSWAEDYSIDLWTDLQHTLEIDPYNSKGSFNGQISGSGNFINLSFGGFDYSSTLGDLYGHGESIVIDDGTDGDGTYNYKSTISDNGVKVQNSAGSLVMDVHCSNITRTYNSTTYTPQWSTSDERAKEEIESLDAELSKNLIDATETHKFKYKGSDGKHYGMIAQEARALLDTLGETDAQLEHSMDIPEDMATIDDQRTIDYQEYIPHLINYVKDLRAELNRVKAELAELKKEGK